MSSFRCCQGDELWNIAALLEVSSFRANPANNSWLAVQCLYLPPVHLIVLSCILCRQEKFQLGVPFTNAPFRFNLSEGVYACHIGTFTIWCRAARQFFTRIEIPSTIFVSQPWVLPLPCRIFSFRGGVRGRYIGRWWKHKHHLFHRIPPFPQSR